MGKVFANTGATVVDSSGDLPAASAGLEGLMFFVKDSNKVMVCSGSAWVEISDLDRAAGLAHIVTQDFSAATTINIDNCFSTDYNNYRVVIYFSTATAANELQLRMRLANTDNTTSNYSIVRTANVNGSLAGSQNDNATAAAWCNYTSGGSASAFMDMFAPFLAAPTLFRSFTTQNVGTTTAAYDYTGNHNVSTSYDGISFLAASGNVTGTVRIYGYKN